MKFPSPLVRGTLLKRHRRSLVDVRLDDGTVVTAHNAAFGQMTACSELGRPILLSESKDGIRRHPHTWEIIDMHGVWVGVNPGNARKAALEAIADRRIPQLLEYQLHDEASFGKGRKIDLVLEGTEHNCFVNIHNVTWAEEDTAWFPDAVSTPAQRSMHELATIVRKGHRAVAIFVVQRADCSCLKPAEQADRDFLRAVLAAESAGVEILAYRAVVIPDEITLGELIPYISG